GQEPCLRTAHGAALARDAPWRESCPPRRRVPEATSMTDSAPRTTYDSAAWLAAIVESSNDAVIGNSLQGVIRSWNSGAERLFGYAAQEVVGQPVIMLFPPDRVHEEADFMRRIHRGERVDRYETIRVRKDGTLIPVSVTLAPITARDGSITGVA